MCSRMDAVASYSSPSPRLESGRVGSGGGQWEMNNIEDSMARMEKLLQRGRALLYGDGASEGRGRHSATLGRVSGGPRESGSHESQRKLRELIEMANAACRAVKRARALDARTRKVKERGAVGWSATQRALPSTLYQQSAALIQAGKRMQMARGGVQQEVLKGGDDREDVPILDLLQRIRRELDDYRRTGLASKGQPCKFARAQKTKEVTSLSLYSRSSTIKSSSLMRLVTPPVTPSQDIRQMFSKGRVSSGGVTTKGPPIENRNAYGKTLGSRRGIGKWNTMYDRSVSFKSLASVASPATKPFAHTYTDPYVARGEPQNNRWETLYAHAVYLQEKRRTYGNDGDALSTKVLQRQISSKGCVPLCPPQPSQHVHRLSGEATVHEQSKRGQSGTNEAQCGTTKPVLDAGSRRFERIIVHPSLSGKPSWGGGECKMRRPVPMRIPTGRQNAPLLSPFGAAERRDGNAETGQNKAQRAEVATTGVAGGGVVPTIGIPRTTPGVSGARAARTTSVPKMPLTPRSLRRTPSTTATRMSHGPSVPKMPLTARGLRRTPSTGATRMSHGANALKVPLTARGLRRTPSIAPSKVAPEPERLRRTPSTAPSKVAPEPERLRRTPSTAPSKVAPEPERLRRTPSTAPSKVAPEPERLRRTPSTAPSKVAPEPERLRRTPSTAPSKVAPEPERLRRTPSTAPSKVAPEPERLRRTPSTAPSKVVPDVDRLKRAPSVTVTKVPPSAQWGRASTPVNGQRAASSATGARLATNTEAKTPLSARGSRPSVMTNGARVTPITGMTRASLNTEARTPLSARAAKATTAVIAFGRAKTPLSARGPRPVATTNGGRATPVAGGVKASLNADAKTPLSARRARLVSCAGRAKTAGAASVPKGAGARKKLRKEMLSTRASLGPWGAPPTPHRNGAYIPPRWGAVGGSPSMVSVASDWRNETIRSLASVPDSVRPIDLGSIKT